MRIITAFPILFYELQDVSKYLGNWFYQNQVYMYQRHAVLHAACWFTDLKLLSCSKPINKSATHNERQLVLIIYKVVQRNLMIIWTVVVTGYFYISYFLVSLYIFMCYFYTYLLPFKANILLDWVVYLFYLTWFNKVLFWKFYWRSYYDFNFKSVIMVCNNYREFLQHPCVFIDEYWSMFFTDEEEMRNER